jgi:hypothetical protein
VHTGLRAVNPQEAPVDIEKVNEIEERLADLKARWPAHSVRPSMLQELEEIEEELRQAKEEK